MKCSNKACEKRLVVLKVWKGELLSTSSLISASMSFLLQRESGGGGISEEEVQLLHFLQGKLLFSEENFHSVRQSVLFLPQECLSPPESPQEGVPQLLLHLDKQVEPSTPAAQKLHAPAGSKVPSTFHFQCFLWLKSQRRYLRSNNHPLIHYRC